jgi:hypothetical protein
MGSPVAAWAMSSPPMPSLEYDPTSETTQPRFARSPFKITSRFRCDRSSRVAVPQCETVRAGAEVTLNQDDSFGLEP